MKINLSGVRYPSCNITGRHNMKVITISFFGFLYPENYEKVGVTPNTLSYKCSPHPPSFGWSPLPAEEGKGRGNAPIDSNLYAP